MDVNDNNLITIPEGIPQIKVEHSQFFKSTKDKILDILRQTFADDYNDTEELIEYGSYVYPGNSCKDENLYIICVILDIWGFLMDTPLKRNEYLVDYWSRLLDKDIDLENSEIWLDKFWRYIEHGLYINYRFMYCLNIPLT